VPVVVNKSVTTTVGTYIYKVSAIIETKRTVFQRDYERSGRISRLQFLAARSRPTGPANAISTDGNIIPVRMICGPFYASSSVPDDFTSDIDNTRCAQ